MAKNVLTQPLSEPIDGAKTYQSEGYDEANTKVTIKATSGAGNVTISTR